MPSARRACCSASSDCPSRRFFRHSLKSFIPASEGDVVPIQWDIGSFLNPAGTSRVTEGSVPLRSARGNRASVQFLGYSLLLSHRTGKNFCKRRVFLAAARLDPPESRSPYVIYIVADTRTVVVPDGFCSRRPPFSSQRSPLPVSLATGPRRG